VDGLDWDTGEEKLSVNRARVVYDYLIKSGIDSTRLSYAGFGSGRKLVKEVTERDRMLNRRVEMKIIKK
jgi:outer membrane protein OmpA-like peptidoglycan-associated protein